MLFTKGNLGVKIDQICEDLAGAISEIGAAANSGDISILTFHAKSSIRADYGPQIDEFKAPYQKCLALPILELTPHFESSFAKLVTEKSAIFYAIGSRILADSTLRALRAPSKNLDLRKTTYFRRVSRRLLRRTKSRLEWWTSW